MSRTLLALAAGLAVALTGPLAAAQEASSDEVRAARARHGAAPETRPRDPRAERTQVDARGPAEHPQWQRRKAALEQRHAARRQQAGQDGRTVLHDQDATAAERRARAHRALRARQVQQHAARGALERAGAGRGGHAGGAAAHERRARRQHHAPADGAHRRARRAGQRAPQQHAPPQHRRPTRRPGGRGG